MKFHNWMVEYLCYGKEDNEVERAYGDSQEEIKEIIEKLKKEKHKILGYWALDSPPKK